MKKKLLIWILGVTCYSYFTIRVRISEKLSGKACMSTILKVVALSASDDSKKMILLVTGYQRRYGRVQHRRRISLYYVSQEEC